MSFERCRGGACERGARSISHVHVRAKRGGSGNRHGSSPMGELWAVEHHMCRREQLPQGLCEFLRSSYRMYGSTTHCPACNFLGEHLFERSCSRTADAVSSAIGSISSKSFGAVNGIVRECKSFCVYKLRVPAGTLSSRMPQSPTCEMYGLSNLSSGNLTGSRNGEVCILLLTVLWGRIY